jgi:hypothetical protein
VRDLEAILSADQDFLAQDSMDMELATELEGMGALAASAVRRVPTPDEVSPRTSRRNRQRR